MKLTVGVILGELFGLKKVGWIVLSVVWETSESIIGDTVGSVVKEMIEIVIMETL